MAKIDQDRLKYGISKYNEQIKRLQEFQKIYAGTKVEEKLGDEIKKFENIVQDLEDLLTKYKKKTVDEKIGIKEEAVAVVKGPEPKATGFTIDAVLVKQAETKLTEGDELVETTNGDIFRELKELRKENKSLHSKNTIIAILGLVGTFGGLFIGLFGGNFIDPIEINIVSNPEIVAIINATNMTDTLNETSTITP